MEGHVNAPQLRIRAVLDLCRCAHLYQLVGNTGMPQCIAHCQRTLRRKSGIFRGAPAGIVKSGNHQFAASLRSPDKVGQYRVGTGCKLDFSGRKVEPDNAVIDLDVSRI